MTHLPPESDYEEPLQQSPDEHFEHEDFASNDVEETSEADETVFNTENNVGALYITPLQGDSVSNEPGVEAETPAEILSQTDQPTRNFEDLTLAELVTEFWRAPGATWQALSEVAQTVTPRVRPIPAPRPHPRPAYPLSIPAIPRAKTKSPDEESWTDTTDELDESVETIPELKADEKQREALALGLRFTALFIAWWGNGILANAPTRTEELALMAGAPLLILGFLIWLASEVYLSWPRITAWREQRSQPKDDLFEERPKGQREEVYSSFPIRLVMALGGTIFSGVAWLYTVDNNFTTLGFYAWLASIMLWVMAIMPDGWRPQVTMRNWWYQLRNTPLNRNWTLIALVVIVLLGALFRLSDLAGTPPEMTSDHVEKILDSQRVLDGTHQVFFPNNGGREGFQMYAMALLSQVPGLSMNFTTLKLLSAIEGLVAIVAVWWLGREVIGAENRYLGNIVGLVLAGLVAASYWHTALSRLGLRIVLTTAVTPILLVYLARAMRDNRRADYIKAGLALGFGLYMYQAVRMLPVVVLIGIGLAFLFKARTMLDRRSYAINLVVLIVIALVVFIPLLNFWQQYPEDFWRRTSGRLFGDDVITATNEEGELVARNPTIGERITAFTDNLPALAFNIRNALLMYNWKGDVAWINAAPNQPTMDTITGALLIVGLAAWLARMFRRRDVVDWLIPIALFVMLLPSALAIAFPIENPSATRTSGSLPEAYLIAALPLGLMMYSTVRIMSRRQGIMVAGGIATLVILLSFALNAPKYFGDYRESYVNSSLPYSDAGSYLRGFAESGGSFGNAFMIAYPYWWDHRALGMGAGLLDWPNGLLSAAKLPEDLYNGAQRTDRYQFDPERDILFMYSPEDEDTSHVLKQLFPNGYEQRNTTYHLHDDFMTYRVPALGVEGFEEFLAEHFTPPPPAG